MQPAIPILRSFDEAKAREFYLGFLGFAVEFEHRFAPDAPLYLSVVRGDCTLHLSEHHGDASPGARLRIGVAGLRAYHDEVSSRPYRYARPSIVEQEWGFLEMAIADPFGNTLVFCQRLAAR